MSPMSPPMMRLVIATPSPFARKVRVALLEKRIPFEAVIENPWLPDTRIGQSNPLGKVPALILPDGAVVHDSKVIIEYLDALDRPPQLIPREPAQRILHKQIEAIADGVCDATVLTVLERARTAQQQSGDWIVRQLRKVEQGTAELARLLGDRPSFGETSLGLAEVATGCALGYLRLRLAEFDWAMRHPNLAQLFGALSARPSFAQTVPTAQALGVIR